MAFGRSAPPVDWLVVGLGNPGAQYDGTPHNVGFQVLAELARRWELPRARDKYVGRFAQGRCTPPGVMPAGPRVAVLAPQTFMNESGRSVGPARGALKLALDRVLVLHDEIDLSFGDVRVRIGGGLAGHNGLKSLKAHLGSPDFARVRIGVGRPDSTEPELVAGYVLGRWRQDREQVDALVAAAADAAEQIVRGEVEL